ncbi:MAG: hypothetical protein GVY04_20035 [Cyanobacteria bacterium]|jgi:hypothetical protein|nr:hypothetical protein [Cyanobacteria bacterium GSL.Bin1]
MPGVINDNKRNRLFWLTLSFTFAILYSFLALQEAFSSEYVIQDDARQHVFWTLRFLDSNLFPNDLIADYFQSVAPLGYSFLYELIAQLGISPIVFSKLLPLGLDLILTGYCWGITLEIFPVPLAGFLSTLLFNQYLWLRDDLVSGTPVAFIYPLFTAFVCYLLRQKLIPCLVSIILLGLFYPQGVLIAAGILVLDLITWKQGKLSFALRQQCQFCFLGIFVSFGVMLFYALKSSAYDPVISAEQARTMLAFLEDGKSEFFVSDQGDYWVTGQRSGLMPRFQTVLPLIATGIFILLLPFRYQFSLFSKISQKVRILVDITLASLGMFLLSHLFLFRLHLPSRYTEHTLRLVSAIAGAMAFVILIATLIQMSQRFQQPYRTFKQSLVISAISLLLAIPIFNPLLMDEFPDTEYVVGNYPNLYQFLQQQPQDSLVASVIEEINNIPVFAKRSILIGGEGYPVPYHLGYYQKIQARTQGKRKKNEAVICY